MFSVIFRRVISVGWIGLAMAIAAPVAAQEGNRPEDALQYKTLVERAKESGQSQGMTLDECIDLALNRNLTIEISRYQPLISREQFHATLGVYDYQLESNIGYSKTERPVLGTLQRQYLRLDTTQSKDLNFGAKISKYISTGGSFSVQSTNDRATNNSNAFNPTYSASLLFSFNQPLWRDFRIDASRRAIINARKDREISDLDFEKQVSDIVKTVEDAYWDLVNAIEQQKIQIASRELSLIQLRDNRKRVEVGTLAPIIITQTMSQVAQSEQSVIASEADIVRAENNLKNLICNDRKDPLWLKVIIPVQTPAVPQAVPELKDLIDRAVKQRPEVKKYKIFLEKDDVDIRYYDNQTKPRLDFGASYATNGVAGPNVVEYDYDDDGNIIGQHPGKFTGSLGTVYEQIFKQEYRDYTIGLTFTYTFGNHAAKANLAAAKLGRDQDETYLRQNIQTISVEVLNAVQTIEVNRKSLLAAIAARQFQEEQLDGQQKRYQAGLTTNFEVLQTQRDLTNAKAAELSALIFLKKSFVELNRATFDILDQNKLDVVTKRSAEKK